VNAGDKVRIKGTDLEGRYFPWMGSHNVDVPGYSRFTLPADLIEPVLEVLDPVEVVDTFGDRLTVQQGAGSVSRVDVPEDVKEFFFDRTNTKALICALQAILAATPEEGTNG
jgi:hypothetical protein